MHFKQIIFITLIILNIFTVVYAQTPLDKPARQMEYLTRATTAVKVSNGVYISWRLLGTESIENQSFDIYRNNAC